MGSFIGVGSFSAVSNFEILPFVTSYVLVSYESAEDVWKKMKKKECIEKRDWKISWVKELEHARTPKRNDTNC